MAGRGDEAPIPQQLRYTREHEWVRDDGEVVAVGITAFAQDQLGDVVYVDLPSPGTELSTGQPFGEVESTKSVSDLFTPVSGTVRERNEALEDQPDLVNEDPYGGGWLITMQARDKAELDELLEADAYQELTG